LRGIADVVDVETDEMAEPVPESVAVPGSLDDVRRGALEVLVDRSGAQLARSGFLRSEDRLVNPPLLGREAAVDREGAGDVRRVRFKFGADVGEDQVAGADLGVAAM
jgi:hypothetical protein